jgi:hypothetical protein
MIVPTVLCPVDICAHGIMERRKTFIDVAFSKILPVFLWFGVCDLLVVRINNREDCRHNEKLSMMAVDMYIIKQCEWTYNVGLTC